MAFVCVEDDGPGIPEQDRKRVFEAFARLDDSRTCIWRLWFGSLYRKSFAYWFGGEIKVDESPSLGGARFIMTWPAHRFKQTPLETNNKHLHKVLFLLLHL